MPYKDPQRKRQWEREHREERNARRRKSSSSHLLEPSGIDSPLPDPKLAQISLIRVSVATGVILGLGLLLTMLILMRRLVAPQLQVLELESPGLP